MVYSPSGLQNLVAQKRPRDRVTVRIYRDGSPRDIRIRLAEATFSATPVVAEAAPELPAAEEKLGIAFELLTEELARGFGYRETGGVIITGVTPLGPAARRLVARGWKILEIDDQAVSTPSDVNRVLSEVEAGEVVSPTT